jgi:hypothetical protein
MSNTVVVLASPHSCQPSNCIYISNSAIIHLLRVSSSHYAEHVERGEIVSRALSHERLFPRVLLLLGLSILSCITLFYFI